MKQDWEDRATDLNLGPPYVHVATHLNIGHTNSEMNSFLISISEQAWKNLECLLRQKLTSKRQNQDNEHKSQIYRSFPMQVKLTMQTLVKMNLDLTLHRYIFSSSQKIRDYKYIPKGKHPSVQFYHFSSYERISTILKRQKHWIH